MTIAIIGAGLAGLSCARALLAAGASVQVFDKGRGAGGRLATRRVAGLQFDHGAQYLTARTEEFAALLRDAGAEEWGQPGWLVGVPGMSALPRAMAAGVQVAAARHVTALDGGPGAWMVRHVDAALVRPGRPLPDVIPDTAGPFDAVAVTAPAPQAGPLVGKHLPLLQPRLDAVVMAPCWTVMAAFGERLPLPDSSRLATGAIGWAARDSSKPGRDADLDCWVVQAGPAWSREHLEAATETIPLMLLREFAALAGAGLPAPAHAAAHRWRYSLVEVPVGQPCLWDAAARLGLAGDWCLAGRAEAAFESGTALARTMLAGSMRA